VTPENLQSFPFPCPNCDRRIEEAVLFCSELCRNEAKFVRYFRACVADGRFFEPVVQEALRIRLAFILGGGYPERSRHISRELRQSVIARDQGRCRVCGVPGDQVDHISGSTNTPENLQVLCRRCHNVKTVQRFVKNSRDTHPGEWAKRESLLSRVHVVRPDRLCDSTEWNNLWQSILDARREIVKNRRRLE
jgi:5-methylcytosine-specific restriction endonuclease McrA